MGGSEAAFGAHRSITNNGQIWSESQGATSLVIVNDVVGTGSARLFDGSTLEFKGAVASSETINFDAPESGEKLIIDAVNATGFAANMMRPADAERLTGYHVGDIGGARWVRYAFIS
jgi:hypothetical protein